MLDGKAYRAHFPDDPAYARVLAGDGGRAPNYAALLQALADLEQEFRAILAKDSPTAP